MYVNASNSYWESSHITNLAPGQSSSGYTKFNKLGKNANNDYYPLVYQKVCTVTCMAANTPTWNWAADGSSCTATFTCSADSSLTATVNADVTTSGGTATASVTFNGTSYTDTKSLVTNYNITYVLNGGANASGNPSTYADNVGVSSFAVPTREHYTFGGWYDNANCTGTPVTSIPAGSSGDRTLYAKWTIDSYTVTWKNSDGSTLKTEQVNYGATPVYSGATPVKPATAQYTYTFTGWLPAVSAVTSDTTYTAQFGSTVNKYKVTWKDADGTVLETDNNVSYGTTPVYNGATPAKPSDDKYSYSFKGWNPSVSSVTGDVTYTATYTKTPNPNRFSQDGNVYIIHDEVGWDVFCDMLADSDKGVFTGKTVELADDITVTRMAGSSYHDFTGTFLGQGHTLTFNSTDAVDYCAPFQYTEGTPVFRDLIIAGTINTSGAYAAGLIGHLYGNVSIESCTSRVEITSNGNSGGFVGLCERDVAFKDCVSSAVIHCNAGNNSGFVGWSRSSNNTISFEGCVFNGKLLKNDGTGNNGGFIGWKGDAKTVTVTNCLYAPALVEGEAFADSNSATFSREHSDFAATITNCYYTRTLGTAQGKQAYTITADNDVTLGLSGDATEYGVSGITAYADSNGIKYGETALYAGSGDTVTLTVAPSAVGYAVNSVSVNDGAVAVTSNENGTYSFTMPASNAAVTAELEEVLSYFDEETGTLTLKGKILNNSGIILPDGINKAAVLHINVDSSGATLPQDSTWLFQNFTNVTSIDLTGTDTSGVEDMHGMFFQCQKLRNLVLSGFDTSRVKNMGYMFGGCLYLKELDLSSFDTSRVEDMNHMFSICGGLTELDLSNFDTSSVRDMNNMFYNCASLETLDLSSFDTSCVVDMSGMFIACVNLTELDLSSFDTSSVKNMEHMFECCDFLKKLDLSSFDTSFVKSMTNMFSGCEHLTELNLSSFDTSCVEDMSGMFSCCYLLKTIYVSEQWSTECVYISNDMFEYCGSLKGGNGTAYDGSKTNREYARIDKDGQPGYLTGTYAVTVPAGITISPVNAIIDSVPFCVKGETITISPREGYIIADAFVFIDIGYDVIEIDITDNNDGTYSFTMPESNVSVEVETAFTDGIGAALAGHSISLEGDIAVNFYMDLDPEIAQSETAYMQFTIPNGSKSETKTVFVKDAREDGGYSIFKCSVAAKDMSSEISAQLIDGDKTSTVYTYSVKEYADWLIEHKNDSEAYTKAAPLVEKMLRYGAYAKEYFDKTNTLPDLGDVNIDSQFASCTSSLPDDLFFGATLSLKSQTTLSLYFTDEEELTFTCVDKDGDERILETVRNGSTQIARIRNIAAKELQDDFTLTVKKGETILGAITYSPMNYCYKALNGGTENENLINAVKALVAYSDAANEYFTECV